MIVSAWSKYASMTSSAPVTGAVRLRAGNAASSRGAASLGREVIDTARKCGCTGLIIVRLDSGFYSGSVVSAIGFVGARFSVTVPVNPSIRAAITAIPGDAWTPLVTRARSGTTSWAAGSPTPRLRKPGTRRSHPRRSMPSPRG